MRSVKRTGWMAAAALLAACGGGGGDAPGGAPAGPPATGGTAVVAIKSDFSGLNPVTNSALATDDVLKQMLFTPLVRFNEQLEPAPGVAESWELDEEGVTFRLRDDLTWHDGRPVTAEDVKFTFDLAKNPETASTLGSVYLGLVESAEVVDPRTIRFRFSTPHAEPLQNFWWAPVPRHALESVDPAQLGQAPFNQQPVGNGPFRFASWRQGQDLTLEANPDYPAALGGRPRLDRVVFRIIPEATTRVNELVSGSADVDYNVLPEEAKQLQAQQGIGLQHYPSREFTYLGWNNELPMFQDARVRRALAMAIDRDRLREALLSGYAQPAGSVVPPLSPLAPEAAPLPFDPAQARQLLAQAGWTDTDGDGIVDRGGQPLRFELITNAGNQLFIDVATVLQSQLREVGVDAQLRPLEFQTMLRQHKARDYQAILTNWTWDYFRVDPSPLFSCEEARKEMSANRAGYCNAQLDALMEQGLRQTDPAQARQTWAQFARLFQQEQPVTPLYWAEEIGGVGPRLQAVEMDARSKLANVQSWWIPQDRQRG